MNYNPHDGEQKSEEGPEVPLIKRFTAAIKEQYPDGVKAADRQEIRDALAQMGGVVLAGAEDQKVDRFFGLIAETKASAEFTRNLGAMIGEMAPPDGIRVVHAAPGFTIFTFDLKG